MAKAGVRKCKNYTVRFSSPVPTQTAAAAIMFVFVAYPLTNSFSQRREASELNFKTIGPHDDINQDVA